MDSNDFNIDIAVGTLLKDMSDNTQWRVIAIENSTCFMIMCGNKKSIIRQVPTTEVATAIIQGTLCYVESNKSVVVDEASLPNDVKDILTKKLSYVHELSYLYGPTYTDLFRKTQKPEFEQLVKKYGFSKPLAFRTIRKWLQSGMQKSSLLDPVWTTGRNIAKSNYKTKTGHPSSTESGIILDANAIEAFDFGVHQFMRSRNMTIRKAYQNMLACYYQNPNAGQPGEMLILSKGQRPTEKQFRYYLSKKVGFVELEKKKTSAREFRNNQRLLIGRPADASCRPGYLLEADAVETDLYLVSSTDRNQLIGRPVVYMMIDVFSGCIVAASVSFENNSNLALSNCLLSLLEDKEELGKKTGVVIDPANWPSRFIPEEIYADRGSDFASDGFLTVCQNLGITRTLEPPAMGSMKGAIEQAFRLYHQTFRAELEHKGFIQKRYDSNHKKTACLTIEDMRKLVYMFVIYHNIQYSENLYYSKEMNKNHIPKIPKEIWNYGIKTYGLPRLLNTAQENEAFFAIMPEVDASIHNGYIMYASLAYREVGDPELSLKMSKAKDNARLRDSDGNLLNKMKVRIDPRLVDFLYYLKNGSVMKLYLNAAKSGSYKGMTWNEYLDYRRSEKEMDISFADYQLNNAVMRNQMVSTFTKGFAPGMVSDKNVREARKVEAIRINKENTIADHISSDIEKQLPTKTEQILIEGNGKKPATELPIADLTSEEVPELFRLLRKKD
ncbi:MAG: transposase family protein [Spirochaetales bacterium]|nr:transposase family protein [Spirochaetales bacterium]